MSDESVAGCFSCDQEPVGPGTQPSERIFVGCTKTYVVQFAEAEGFAHTHVHVIPRAADMPEDRIGPAVFGCLGGPESAWTSQPAMDALAARLAPVIERGVNA